MRHLFIAFLCISLGACAFAPLTTDNRFAALDDKIATDTANQLARLYPPARTQFSLVVSDPASFGALLAGKLRAKGYALSEKAVERTRIMPPDTFGAVFSPKPADEARSPMKTPAAEQGTELRYVLDHSKDFSRITMVIGGAVLARAYLVEDGAIAPAGAWTMKE